MAHECYTLRRDKELAKLKKRLMEYDLVLPIAFETYVKTNYLPYSPPTPHGQSPIRHGQSCLALHAHT